MSLITQYTPSYDAIVCSELRVACTESTDNNLAVLLDSLAVPLGSGQKIEKNQQASEKEAENRRRVQIQF